MRRLIQFNDDLNHQRLKTSWLIQIIVFIRKQFNQVDHKYERQDEYSEVQEDVPYGHGDHEIPPDENINQAWKFIILLSLNSTAP